MVVLIAGLAVALASWLLARASGYRRGAEVALASWCIASTLVAAPMHALAGFGLASRAGVGWMTVLVVTLSIGAALFVRGPRGVVVDLRALVPSKAPLALLIALPAAAVLLHALVATVLLPSEGWDGIWYHETIVGWTIQTGSSAPMPLPPNLLQQANGFPRNAELTCAWIVLLSDRSLIELPNAIALAPLGLATGLLAARYADKRTAVAVATIVALVPGAILQARTTYVDVYAAAACGGALYFATKRPLAPKDVALAGMAMALHVGSKPAALLVSPILLVFLLVRATRSAASAVRVTGGAAAVLFAISASLVYVRNARLFGNPLYPLKLELPRLGVSWPGVVTSSDLDMNASASDTLASIFLPATPGRDFADVRWGGYGLGVAWVLLPLAFFGIGRALTRLRSSGRATERRAAAVARTRGLDVLTLVALALPSLLLSTAIWSARYNLHAVVVLGAAAAFVPRAKGLRTAALGAGLLLSVVAIARFDPPLGDATWARLSEAARMSKAERAWATRAEWTIEPTVARSREEELEPGDLVVFGDGVAFPSVLWDERFENRILYVPETGMHELDVRLKELGPRWIVAAEGEPLHRYVTGRPDRWERIGLASRNRETIAFRRRTP